MAMVTGLEIIDSQDIAFKESLWDELRVSLLECGVKWKELGSHYAPVAVM